MKFLALDRMWDRVNSAKENSKDDYFNTLMYLGESFTKLVVSGMIAVVNDGRERHQYRLKYNVVRSDGIGGWNSCLDEILTGVPAQHLASSTDIETRQLTERVTSGNWQYDTVASLDKCLRLISPSREKLATKLSAKLWFNLFAELRNKTRGHGALSSNLVSSISTDLHNSMMIFCDNFSLFQRGWAYLSETQKGKYRVTRWNDQADTMSFLKTREGIAVNLPEGLYIHFGTDTDVSNIRRVELIFHEIDSDDIFFPNGAFNGKKMEVISYISGLTKKIDANDYLTPVGALPPSETQGLEALEQRKESIVNLPPLPPEYIDRDAPEKKLYEEITTDNQHRIVTLIGRGGIGKTWLSLRVLSKVADENHFAAILWFSARDVDLLPDGPKQVQPHVLTEPEIAREFTRLFGRYFFSIDQINTNEIDELDFLRKNMLKCEYGPLLFVFDNFETVKNPVELYNWLDQYIRLPNKAIITTRFREFKGDYPVELRGMSSDECNTLIDLTAGKLGILHLMTSEYRASLYRESDGHPYVVKILLGEVKKSDHNIKVEKILATQENILEALFERTYARLSDVAKRVFLTLCTWKSFIPQLAIEAVLLRSDIEQSSIEQAIEDLSNSSLIETFTSKKDGEVFLSVPLVTRKFGERKYSVSRHKVAIQADTELLQFFGAAQEVDLVSGVTPRIQRLIRNITNRAVSKSINIIDYLPVLEFIAKRYPRTWLNIADIFRRLNDPNRIEQMLQKFLEFSDDSTQKQKVRQELAEFYSVHSQYQEELFVRFELSQIADADFDIISESANRVNHILRQPGLQVTEHEKEYIVEGIINVMEKRVKEATATDCSRLGWLYMRKSDIQSARTCAERGLLLDSTNEHCIRLLQRINGG